MLEDYFIIKELKYVLEFINPTEPLFNNILNALEVILITSDTALDFNYVKRKVLECGLEELIERLIYIENITTEQSEDIETICTLIKHEKNENHLGN